MKTVSDLPGGRIFRIKLIRRRERLIAGLRDGAAVAGDGVMFAWGPLRRCRAIAADPVAARERRGAGDAQRSAAFGLCLGRAEQVGVGCHLQEQRDDLLRPLAEVYDALVRRRKVSKLSCT